MVRFQGFATRQEAQEFKKKNWRGLICGKDGPNRQDWKDCVTFGGLDGEKFPFAVQWNISSRDSW